MPKSDEEIIKAVTERMSKRRNRESEESPRRGGFTMSYAVSVATGRCYVGYNLKELKLNMTRDGSGACAENRAAYVAASYSEKIDDLVLFALNDRSEFFNPCEGCQRWVWRARGYLKNQSGRWIISTMKPNAASSPVTWEPHILNSEEQETLYQAGERIISEESNQYFSNQRF